MELCLFIGQVLFNIKVDFITIANDGDNQRNIKCDR